MPSGSRIIDREILFQFIKLYRENQCLWNTKSQNYLNQLVRLKSYKILLQKLKEVDKYATIATVKTKINSLRTNFRNEYKKVQASKQSGAKGDDIYEPSLWYYKSLLFLVDEHVPVVNVKEEKINKMTDMRSLPRSFILEFIELYRQHECLWNINCSNYKNKFICTRAYETLRLKCMQIDTEATIEMVKKKINSMRTNFFAYYKKISKLQESGSNENCLQSKLYYFDSLKFLLNRNPDTENSHQKKDSRSVSPEENKTKNSESWDENESTKSESIEDNKTNRRSEFPAEKRRKKSESSESENQRIELLDMKRRRIESTKDGNKRNRSESPLEYKLFENVEVFDLQSADDDELEFEEISQKSHIEHNYTSRHKRMRNYNHIQKEKEDTLETTTNSNRSRRSKPFTMMPMYRQKHDEFEEDEYDIYGKYIASEIGTLPPEDLIFVKKLFNDTLFEAKLGNAKCMRIIANSKLQLTSDEHIFK